VPKRRSRCRVGRTLTTDGVDLFWVPLGLGPHGALVRWTGRLYEAVVAARARRPRRDLYHSALMVRTDGVPSRIELAVPVQRGDRGVVAEGPVGSRVLRRSHLFRYEVRCWARAPIPAVPSAVDGPICVSSSSAEAGRVLALVPEFPTCTWGRDELGAWEMWNSNSLVSWLLARAGISTDGIRPPSGGRAPGWDAGLRVAARSG
jgi:hypothetical protein